jgi:hypothetical protein
MMRTLRGLGLVPVVLLLLCKPAKADLWDWFAELSGQGPFSGRGNVMATIYCRGTGDRGTDQQWFGLLDKGDTRVTCWSADVRRFKADDNDRFFPTRMEVYEAGPMYRLGPPFELGFSMGVIHFDSSGVKTNRLTLSFPRLAFKPLLLTKWTDPNWGFIQLYFRETRIVGELTQDDFRPKPGVTFRAVHDFVPSTGFIIDAPAFLRLVKVIK